MDYEKIHFFEETINYSKIEKYEFKYKKLLYSKC
jgi:hypothetical protein